MIRKALSLKLLVAIMAVAVVAVGVNFAGGDCCAKNAAKTVKAGKGYHCHLGMTQDIVKTARMTRDGAVVTFAGKSDRSVEYLRAHLGKHEKGGGDCADCPMSMDGVTTSVKLTKKGGVITMVGSTEKTIERVQAWAEKPADCCENASAA